MNRRLFLQGCTLAGSAALLENFGTGNGWAKESMLPPKNRPLALPLRDVRITDDFWAPKIAVWRLTMINDCFDKFEKSGALENFDRVAAGKTGGNHGDPWWDGLVYEMIAGSAHFLAAHPDAELEKRIDGYVDRIAAAAAVDPDGYINTAVTLAKVAPRWSDSPAPGDKHDDRFPHTLYNAGCLVEAGVQYQRATGKTRLLQIATRMANYMCRLMGSAPKQNIVPGHALPEMAFFDLALLYREHPELRRSMNALGDGHAYADLAQFWIDNRGNHAGRATMEVYAQDDKPVQQQTTMEGHAVRSALLAAGVARGAIVANRSDYGAIGARWWQNMVEAKEYITGGLGAIPAFEGFGPDYELPNNGYCETCAAVAGGLFDQEMFLGTGQGKYIDALERVLYNGALSGVSVAGTSYFYTNYLATDSEVRRWDWHSCPCCPPMFLKLMGAMPSYIYATDMDGIYVNLYVGSEATAQVKGKAVQLRQKTEYPWQGQNALTVSPAQPERFVVRLRLPEWAKQATASVNGKEVSAVRGNDGYLRLDRVWKPGDTVTLSLPMPVQRMYADKRVVADQGRVALMRGPVVYCLEGIDCDTSVPSVILPTSAAIAVEHRPNLLGGVTVLTGTAQVVRGTDVSEEAPQLQPTAFTAIPYYANNNRQPTTMAVWIAEDKSVATPQTLAGTAKCTASHANPSDTLTALSDGVLPKASDDESVPRFTWWDHRGSAEWVQYDFPQAQQIGAVAVYWWDERRVGRHCRVPQNWRAEYRDGDTWKPVSNPSAYGTEIDKLNRTTFDPVETTALRLVVQLQPEWSAGILEWQLFSSKNQYPLKGQRRK